MLTNYEMYEMAQEHQVPLVTVCCKNRLPSKKRDGGYIINMADAAPRGQRRGIPGTHWVALWCSGNDPALYFDSFGMPPPEEVVRFTRGMYIYSTKHIQNLHSGVCGWYCFLWLYWLSRGGSYRDFLTLWSDDPTDNRRIMQRLLRLLPERLYDP